MIKIIKLTSILLILLNLTNSAIAKNSFFKSGKIKYNEEKYVEAKFLFQRSIVLQPRHINAYLYLAKIYKIEDNEKEEEKNINTVLLLEPKNEEALFILMKIELRKSNYLKVKELTETFSQVCKNLCEKKDSILDTLKNLERKNES